MEFISMENWQMARDIIALMICCVAVSCLIKGRSGFYHIFSQEMNRNKDHKQTKKEIQDLRAQLEDIRRAGHKPEQLRENEISEPLRVVYPSGKLKAKTTMRHYNGGNRFAPPANQPVRVIRDSIANTAKVETNDPVFQAELDFKLKFERLSKLKKMHFNNTGRSASGR